MDPDSEIETITENELINNAMLLTKRYNEITSVVSCLSTKVNYFMHNNNYDDWKVNAFDKINMMRKNLILLKEVIINCRENK